jgi:hypothetical protein
LLRRCRRTCCIPAAPLSPRQRSKSKSHAQPARGKLPAIRIYRRGEIQSCFVQILELGAFFSIYPAHFSCFSGGTTCIRES